MIELSMDSIQHSPAEQAAALKLRENAILEFSDGEEGYLIEELPDDTYRYVYFGRRSIESLPSPVFCSIYDALNYAIFDWTDSHPSSVAEWFGELDRAEKRLMGLTGELDIKTIEEELMAQFPPKRALFALEGHSKPEEPQANGTEVQESVEASIARSGPILDRLEGNLGLIYLVQRTRLNLFRFVVLEPGKEPRYGGSQTTELRQVYELIQRDAKANYEYRHWFPMADDLGAFLGRSEEKAESYLILKKLYRHFPELSQDGRKFSEVLAAAEEIAEIFKA